ncbi:alpha/beta fold hydrolase [Colwellia sp. 1_MG-2023]|uniref:alpha/beta hydrolase family protein n=1 Tax=unclassified Colwellia TaxID=196834 RepID=UPI001C090515|nr:MULTISPECIES: alpha/beta fold hydrolase [unclassified Colwellia]MBU2926026.1 alpha/beta hydrolase [Colwellia sp. C2M11]MDO6653167.1 alpha/beta fold hydrolase [Colwellia sp. 3_MG-2023]MDO6666080.1 alpha/beta fold hydrolase [Colwellia sp. 2_MG-2023]MDO6690434.1 alpha/beta fold hydrolase [Colwellia sp. 1_MG-2023]
MKKLKYRYTLSICTLLLNIILMPAYAAIEQELSLKGDNYQIPAILTLPDFKSLKPFPVVIMLHGTASNKNEVGNLFKRLAEKLAKQNVASIRFDFAGSGASSVDYKVYNLENAVNDVVNVHQFIQQQKRLEHKSIHLLGFSQGGLIAQLAAVNETLPVASMVTWSSVAGNGIGSFQPFFTQYEQEAINNGFAEINYPWLDKPLNFSHQWFEQIRNNTSLTQMAMYQGRLLAIAGDADKTVPWQNSLSLIKGAKQAQTSLYLIKNANHIFNVLADNSAELNNDQSLAEELLAITAHYFIDQTKQ